MIGEVPGSRPVWAVCSAPFESANTVAASYSTMWESTKVTLASMPRPSNGFISQVNLSL